MRIKSLTIRGLRGIAQGTIPDLAPMTVLLGPNGCGTARRVGITSPGPSGHPLRTAALIGRHCGGQKGSEVPVRTPSSVLRENLNASQGGSPTTVARRHAPPAPERGRRSRRTPQQHRDGDIRTADTTMADQLQPRTVDR